MRNPERIDRIVNLVRECWQLEPGFRLTQLVMVVSGHPENGASVWHDEDESMERKLQSFIDGRRRAKASQKT